MPTNPLFPVTTLNRVRGPFELPVLFESSIAFANPADLAALLAPLNSALADLASFAATYPDLSAHFATVTQLADKQPLSSSLTGFSAIDPATVARLNTAAAFTGSVSAAFFAFTGLPSSAATIQMDVSQAKLNITRGDNVNSFLDLRAREFYANSRVVFGLATGFGYALSATPTANRTATFPNKSGTVAMLDDIPSGGGAIPSTTNILSGDGAGNVADSGVRAVGGYITGASLGGTLNLDGTSASNGGTIYLNGGAGLGSNGGAIWSFGGAEPGAHGGGLYMYGSSLPGGDINTSDGGGNISTASGGGDINTQGTGTIGLGTAGTRTTLTGTATADRSIHFPDADGTVLLSNGWVMKTANYTAVSGDMLFADTRGGAFTIGLPAIFVDGDFVIIYDVAGDFVNHGITLDGEPHNSFANELIYCTAVGGVWQQHGFVDRTQVAAMIATQAAYLEPLAVLIGASGNVDAGHSYYFYGGAVSAPQSYNANLPSSPGAPIRIIVGAYTTLNFIGGMGGSVPAPVIGPATIGIEAYSSDWTLSQFSPAGLTETLNFYTGGVSGNVATLTVANGTIIAKTVEP